MRAKIFFQKYLAALLIFPATLIAVPVAKSKKPPVPPAAIESAHLTLSVDEKGLMTLRDKRNGRQWAQSLSEKSAVVALEGIERLAETGLRLKLRCQKNEFAAEISFVADGAELEVSLTGGEMPDWLCFPQPFLPATNATLVLAIKEGLSVPVTDTTVFFDNQKRGAFEFFEGHNSSMPFWGYANADGSGLMTIVMTPNDAGFRISRLAGVLTDQVVWRPEFGKFGYPRKVRYVPLGQGGYVAMAQRYRKQAEQEGLVRTLAEKIRENPEVEKLLGAADVWFNDHFGKVKDYAAVAQELKALGIEHVIFGGGSSWMQELSPKLITELKKLGYLANRYDCLQDVMPPENLGVIRGVSPIYLKLQSAWPDDVVRLADGSPLKGWPVGGKDGKTYYCGRLTDTRRLDYAKKLIPPDLAERPYTARFLDTEAATPWTENYDAKNRATRSQVRDARMSVLDFISRDCKQVTGSEGLQGFAVPHLHYFEGVAPIEPFRVDDKGAHPFATFPADYDWGTNMTRLLKVSHRYLIPLWQLVYHDCVVTYPRWNTANNKFANPLWKTKQALFCALYGRPPIFMMDPEWWGVPANRAMLAEIYGLCGPLARKVGTARMTDHRWLDAAGDVQQTRFGNGVVVTVNFAEAERKLADGTAFAAWSVSVR